MRLKQLSLITVVALVALLVVGSAFAQSAKIGYINSQKILSEYKEAKDVQKQIDELNRQWEKEGLEMQKELEQLREQFDSQSLLLSESKKAEKAQEIQNLYLKMQQFQQQKWAPGTGEIYKKQEELMAPVLEKINGVIKQLGDDEKYDYIFDTVAGNILYASDKQVDLTDKVLEELQKSTSTGK
jgi:outer membrane protein